MNGHILVLIGITDNDICTKLKEGLEQWKIKDISVKLINDLYGQLSRECDSWAVKKLKNQFKPGHFSTNQWTYRPCSRLAPYLWSHSILSYLCFFLSCAAETKISTDWWNVAGVIVDVIVIIVVTRSSSSRRRRRRSSSSSSTNFHSYLLTIIAE